MLGMLDYSQSSKGHKLFRFGLILLLVNRSSKKSTLYHPLRSHAPLTFWALKPTGTLKLAFFVCACMSSRVFWVKLSGWISLHSLALFRCTVHLLPPTRALPTSPLSPVWETCCWGIVHTIKLGQFCSHAWSFLPPLAFANSSAPHAMSNLECGLGDVGELVHNNY